MLTIIFDDLKKIFGEKILLRPEDLETILGIGKGQQANLRSQNRFPIPTKKIGGSVVVTIYDLAKYLASACDDDVKTKMANEPPAPKEKQSRSAKKAQKGLLGKDWWRFRVGTVISILEERPLFDVIYKKPLPPSNPFEGAL